MGDNKGQALFIIFVALFSFAALMFAVSGTTRSGATTIQRDVVVLDASVARQCHAHIEFGKQRLRVFEGCQNNQISFENAQGLNANTNAPINKSCHLFHVNGADITPCGVYAGLPPPLLQDDTPDPEPGGPGLGMIDYGDTQTIAVLENGALFQCTAFGTQSHNHGQCTHWQISTDGVNFSNKDICFAKNIVERLVRGLLALATDFGRTICAANCITTDTLNVVAHGTTGGNIGYYYTTDRTLEPYSGSCAGHFKTSQTGSSALACNCWGENAE